MAAFSSLINLITPKKKAKKGGQSVTNTYNPNTQDGVLTAPLYREHLQDIFETRQVNDSRELLKTLFTQDPDVSASVNAFLTVADTEPVYLVYDFEGNLDPAGAQQLQHILVKLGIITDYSKGFQLKQDLYEIYADMRYMALLRGAIGAELVFDEKLTPDTIRLVDMATIEWREKRPGEFKPFQIPPGYDDEINLDIPTFFVAYHRRDPTSVYSSSFFVSAINTIAARQQVINDLYRIMRYTGYPRIDIEIIEDILLKNAPANVRDNQAEKNNWVRARIQEISTQVGNLRADQALVHTDSVKAQILNEKMGGMGADVKEIVAVLNAQNQAALKTMSTIIGRGETGVNTASVEARIFAMVADELNMPVGSLMGRLLSFAMQMYGYQGYVEVYFKPAELRPETELEAQLTMRAERLKRDLSLGLITDDEYHLAMYNRPRPPESPELSGTGFLEKEENTVDVEGVTPNSDPLGRSVASKTDKQARSNDVKRS